MFRLFENRHIRVIAQVLFWAALIGAISLMLMGMNIPAIFYLRNYILTALAVLLVALNTYWLVPQYFSKSRYGSYSLLLGGIVLAFVLMTPMLENSLISMNPKLMGPPLEGIKNIPMPPVGSKMHRPTMLDPRHFILFVIFSAVVLLSTVMESVQLHRHREQAANKAEREKLAAELKFLKSQINPHFLFNVLNNVYALSLLKSDQTPEVVMKLSEMLRYMLYQSGHERASLEQEISYIQHYIALQQLKDDEPLSVQLDLQVNNPTARIAPMLLIPFVENAFKHSKIEDTQQGWIKISLGEMDNQLVFSVSNSLPSGEFTKDLTGGIGLTNVQRRLELEYPGKHQLDIKKMPQSFSIELTISLL